MMINFWRFILVLPSLLIAHVTLQHGFKMQSCRFVCHLVCLNKIHKVAENMWNFRVGHEFRGGSWHVSCSIFGRMTIVNTLQFAKSVWRTWLYGRFVCGSWICSIFGRSSPDWNQRIKKKVGLNFLISTNAILFNSYFSMKYNRLCMTWFCFFAVTVLTILWNCSLHRVTYEVALHPIGILQ